MQILSERSTTRSFTHGEGTVLPGRQLINIVALALGDVLAILLALVAAVSLRDAAPGITPPPGWAWFLVGAWLLGAFMRRLLPGWGLGAPTELKRLTELTLIVFASTATLLLFVHQADTVRRTALVLGLVFAWPLLIVVRGGVKQLLMRARLWGMPTVIYGGASTGKLLISALRDQPDFGYVPMGVFDDNPALQGTRIQGVPVLGPASSTTKRAAVAILAMPGIGRERTVELLEGPLSVYRNVVIIPDLFETESLWVTARDFNGVLGLKVTRNLLNPAARWGKRAFDVVATLLTAPVWLPVCLLVALAIWLEDRASPVFLQKRVGLDGALFNTWKFRTMVPNAEEVLRRTLETNPELRAEWEANYKLRRDPRVTRVGVFLRKTSFDELPQLVNVLLGDMSLVGPRPLPPYHYQQLSGQVQRLRERVRPGMTGLWQVSGRSEAGNAGMERWDPYYVRNWSMWLDLVILLRTVTVVLLGSGAY